MQWLPTSKLLALAAVLLISNGDICSINNSEHLDGEWVINPQLDVTPKSFYCCKAATQGERDPMCDGTLDDYGSFDTESLLYTGVALRTTNDACACDIREGGKSVVNSVDSYVWRPRSCELPDWDADLFCELLGDRRVLLAGDSTFAQTAYMLDQMISYNSTTVRRRYSGW